MLLVGPQSLVSIKGAGAGAEVGVGDIDPNPDQLPGPALQAPRTVVNVAKGILLGNVQH